MEENGNGGDDRQGGTHGNESLYAGLTVQVQLGRSHIHPSQYDRLEGGERNPDEHLIEYISIYRKKKSSGLDSFP